MTAFKQINLPAIVGENQQGLRKFDKDLLRQLQEHIVNLEAILNRGIKFADNVDSTLISVTSHATPGTEFSVAHGLGKVPTGYIVYGRSKAGTVYDGGTANTKTTLYLKSDASSGVFKLIVF